jgi:hypothetical protein
LEFVVKEKDIEKISDRMGGATLTRDARENTLSHVSDTLKEIGVQVAKLDDLKTRHIERYIEIQQERGISDRTLQNRMAHIRTSLRDIGRVELANGERLSSKALGIDGANRDGTHRALSAEAYTAVLEAAKARDAGFGACVAMQRELGLRAREAVMSVKNLESWKQALERGHAIRVFHGTKGGHGRDTMPVNKERALEAVKTALEAISSRGGQLIQSKSLEGAMRAFGRHSEAIGLKGVNASHCLRYGYAQERFQQLLERLGDRTEALAATSVELGHGDGRGTYIAQVYLK